EHGPEGRILDLAAKNEPRGVRKGSRHHSTGVFLEANRLYSVWRGSIGRAGLPSLARAVALWEFDSVSRLNDRMNRLDYYPATNSRGKRLSVRFAFSRRQSSDAVMDTNRRPTLESPLTAFLIGLSPLLLTILAVAATKSAGTDLVIGLLAGALFIFFVVRHVNRRDDPRHAKRPPEHP